LIFFSLSFPLYFFLFFFLFFFSFFSLFSLFSFNSNKCSQLRPKKERIPKRHFFTLKPKENKKKEKVNLFGTLTRFRKKKDEDKREPSNWSETNGDSNSNMPPLPILETEKGAVLLEAPMTPGVKKGDPERGENRLSGIFNQTEVPESLTKASLSPRASNYRASELVTSSTFENQGPRQRTWKTRAAQTNQVC
jgi:hypothetical protein